MESSSAWYQVCICGHTFGMLQAYSYHKRTCRQTKKRLASALEKAKEVWRMNKHRKIEERCEIPVAEGSASPDDITPGLDPADPLTVLFHASSSIPCNSLHHFPDYCT